MNPWEDPIYLAAKEAAASVTLPGQAERLLLTAALEATELYPFPTLEEDAILSSQVTAALDAFIALTDPPADVVATAASLTAWKATRA